MSSSHQLAATVTRHAITLVAGIVVTRLAREGRMTVTLGSRCLVAADIF
jgi:hypothetical protein